MITIIHGTDIVASRKFFLEEKEKITDTQLLDGEKVTLTDLTQIFEGGGLFEETKTIFIEHFFARKKRKDEFSVFVDYLQKQSTHTIYLWEAKELEKSSLSNFKSAIPRVFKLPQTLFLFLDNFKPGNSKQLINLFHQTLETTDAEMIFFMLVRQVRLLLALSSPVISSETRNPTGSLTNVRDDKTEPIDEFKRLAPWQRTKLEQQANAFGKKKLLNIYEHLFLLEKGQKTGNLSNTILTNIDFLLLEI
jgi:hypothetical protein